MSAKLITCSVCGTEMASTAKACPKCGAKNKKPIYKNPLVIILLIVVVLFAGRTVMKSMNATKITFPSGETVSAKEVKSGDYNSETYATCTVELTVRNVNIDGLQFIYSKDFVSIDFDGRKCSADEMDTIRSLKNGDKIRVKAKLSDVNTVELHFDYVSDIKVIG